MENLGCYTDGMVKNVQIKLDKFSFPSDMIVIEMEKCPLLLGRSYLTTTHIITDVEQGEGLS